MPKKTHENPNLPSAPPVGSVPYHTLPPEKEGKCKWIDGQKYTLPSGATVAVFRSPETGRGLFFKITNPQPDGVTSVLKFRLSEEAAACLAALIDMKLQAPNKD